MLHELAIESFAVVEELRAVFRPGLNLVTGETGSGKSIVVDALALLFGARADADVVRGAAERARIAGIFEPPPSPRLAELLDEAGLPVEEELLIERHVLAGGRTRAYVNGRPAPVTLLRELAPLLGDIHGQHEQQNLFSTAAQLEMLDAFAGTSAAAAAVGALHRERREAEARLAELRGREQERLRLLDLYRFQAEEIAQAALAPGEEEELGQERRKLQNVVRLSEAASAACEALYESSVSAAAQLKAALRRLEQAAADDPALEPLIATLESARAGVEDSGFELERYLDRLEADPGRLDAVEERLALLERLKRKYGGDLPAVIAFGDEASKRLRELEESDVEAERLEGRRQQLWAEFEKAAGELSERRRSAARRLEEQVEAELAELALERARFRVAFEPIEGGGPDGLERIRYDFSANPGQPERPLAQTASGGELSRVTLALKNCLLPETPAEPGAVARTLVFDEVDAGVGGRVAEAVGRRLQRLARSHQVLCVTHLPQIAGFADAHYFVEKREREGQTFALMTALDPAARVQELARMLSGARVTKAALENARQILEAATSERPLA